MLSLQVEVTILPTDFVTVPDMEEYKGYYATITSRGYHFIGWFIKYGG